MAIEADRPTSPAPGLYRAFGAILVVLGALFAAEGAVMLAGEIAFGWHAVAAVGRIADVRVAHSADGQVFTPVVEFTTREGRTVTFDGVSRSPAPTRGETVPVLYRPGERPDPRIDRFLDRWLVPCAFLPVGLAGFAAGVHLARGGKLPTGAPDDGSP